MSIVTLQQHHQTISDQLTSAISDAERYFGQSFAMPEIRYDLRGQTAGLALLREWVIRLNTEILFREPESFIAEVPKHELAHLITHKMFGPVKPHGKEWKLVMSEIMQLPPKTTHRFEVTKTRQERTFPYSCQCEGQTKVHQLGIRRHYKVLRKQANYLCTRCKTPLVSQS